MTTSPDPARPSEVLVVDMMTLRFRTDTSTGAVRVTTRTGQVLAALHPRRRESRADLAFRAMDAALGKATFLAPDPADPAGRRRRSLALYNPLSGHIAWGPAPETVTFTTGSPLPVDPDGTVGVVEDTSSGPQLRMGQLVAPSVVLSEQQVTRSICSQAAMA